MGWKKTHIHTTYNFESFSVQGVSEKTILEVHACTYMLEVHACTYMHVWYMVQRYCTRTTWGNTVSTTVLCVTWRVEWYRHGHHRPKTKYDETTYTWRNDKPNETTRLSPSATDIYLTNQRGPRPATISVVGQSSLKDPDGVRKNAFFAIVILRSPNSASAAAGVFRCFASFVFQSPYNFVLFPPIRSIDEMKRWCTLVQRWMRWLITGLPCPQPHLPHHVICRLDSLKLLFTSR